MASDDFASASSPLASPWANVGPFGTLRATGGGCQNTSGTGVDSGMRRTDSSVGLSRVTYKSGTADGGPAIECSSDGDMYFTTAYDGKTYIFRTTNGGSFTQLGASLLGVGYTANDVLELRRSAGNVIYKKVGGADLMTRADATHSGTGNPGLFIFAANMVLDDWTDGVGGTAYSLALAQGSYSLTGQAAALRADRKISAAQGAYALNGQSVALTYSGAARSIATAQGSYSLSGQAVTLVGPSVGYSLAMGQGSYMYTGSDAAVDLEMNMDAGSYALSGNAVGLKYGHKLGLAQGAYTLSGQPLAIKVDRRLILAQGTYAYTGNDVALSQHAPAPRLTVVTGQYNLDAMQVNLLYSGNRGEIFHSIPLNWWTKGL